MSLPLYSIVEFAFTVQVKPTIECATSPSRKEKFPANIKHVRRILMEAVNIKFVLCHP